MSKKNKTGSTRNKIFNKQNLVSIITAGLVYVGVPPTIAPVVANIIVTIVAWGLLMGPLITFAFFLVALTGSSTMSTNYENLDPSIKNVTSEVSRKYNVPESILVGLARHQTNFGTTSPYDPLTHSLNEAGTLTPAIGDKEDLDQGLGVYLLSSGFIKNNPEYELDPQNFLEQTELIGFLIKQKMDYLSSLGFPPPTDSTNSDIYWAEILNNLPIADPSFTKWTCSSTSNSIVRKISDIWSCEFKKNGARIYYQNPDNPSELILLQTSDAIPVVIDDALNFAWNFNKFKKESIKKWEDISLSECVDGTGVFPVSKNSIKDKSLNLCTADINIDEAAKIFIKNLKQNYNEGPYSKIYAGWSYFDSQVGSFDKSKTLAGPFSSRIPDQCVNATDSFVTAYVSNLDENSSLITALNNSENGPRGSTFCTGVSNDEIVFLASKKILEYSNSETGDNGYLSEVIKESNLYIEENFKPSKEKGFIPRLATYPIFSDLPFDNSTPTLDSTLGYKILGEALFYGSTFPGDTRAGNNPYEGIASGVIQGVNLIALDRVDPLKEQNVPLRSDPRLSLLTCNSRAEKEFALTAYQVRWDKMCADARQSGVSLFVTSSWRSYEEQVEIAKKYEGQDRAAKPGSSPHEKGSAVDVYLGSNDGLEGDSKKEYAWLHSIVGCYNKQAKSYRQFPLAILPSDYVENLKSGGVTCAGNEIPIKRVQTYGLTPLCLNHYSGFEKYSDSDVVKCSYEPMKSSSSGQKREAWHLDLGIIENVISSSAGLADCSSLKLDLTSDRTVAVSIKNIWSCNLSNLGYDKISVDGSGAYVVNLKASNLAEQVASEAVLVSYCSTGFNTQFSKNNRKGIFALDSRNISEASLNGRQNIDSAIKLWISNYNLHRYYHGWEDFLYVDAGTYEESNLSKFSILGRFSSQAPYPSVGDPNKNVIPAWASNPESFFENAECADFYKGKGNS